MSWKALKTPFEIWSHQGLLEPSVYTQGNAQRWSQIYFGLSVILSFDPHLHFWKYPFPQGATMDLNACSSQTRLRQDLLLPPSDGEPRLLWSASCAVGDPGLRKAEGSGGAEALGGQVVGKHASQIRRAHKKRHQRPQHLCSLLMFALQWLYSVSSNPCCFSKIPGTAS